MNPATNLFNESTEATCEKNFRQNKWGIRHSKAIDDALRFASSSRDHRMTQEHAIVLMLRGWCVYADAHRSAFDSGIMDDGVLGPQWESIGEGIKGLLDGILGNLDAGTISSLIGAILESEPSED